MKYRGEKKTGVCSEKDWYFSKKRLVFLKQNTSLFLRQDKSTDNTNS